MKSADNSNLLWESIYKLPTWRKSILLLLAMGNFTYYCLVFVLFKGDCIITAHDNLDSINSWLEMFRQNNLFLSVSKETPCFLGLSTENYALIGFSFQSFLFAIFQNFTAFALNYSISFVLACLGMFIFLENIIKKNTFLNAIVSLLFAGLPVIPSYAIAVATIPYFFWAMHSFYIKDNKLDKRVFLLGLFPFFSSFPTTIDLWLIPLTASKELPILLLKLLE